MMSLTGRFRTARQWLGRFGRSPASSAGGHSEGKGPRLLLPAALSALVHLAALVGLASYAAHPDRASGGDPAAEEERVEVSTVGYLDGTALLPGDRLAPPEGGGGEPAGGTPAVEHGPAADGDDDATARPAAAHPAATAPARRKPATPERLPPPAVRAPARASAPHRAERASPRPPPSAGVTPSYAETKPARLATAAPSGIAIDVGDHGEHADTAPGADRTGTSDRSPLAQFRAELKSRLKAAWRPLEIYQRLDPRGDLQGTRLITSLLVRLRADGTAESAAVNTSSGYPTLDSEAMAALHRALPTPRLPDEILDDRGGFDVRCSFHLDIGLFRFARELHKAIAEEWHPSKAFQVNADRQRKTVVRLTVDRRGALASATVTTSAGIDFLDSGARAAIKPGMKLPAPPPNFFRRADAVPVVVAFDHALGNVHILLPRDDLDED